YRLGHHEATGVLTICAQLARAEVFVLRRGAAVVGTDELARKALIARFARLASQDLSLVFEGGVTGVMPVGATAAVGLADWSRAHLEAQLDGALADAIVRELAGVRLVVRSDLAPVAHDEADRRMLVAMAMPRRLDQIWPLARTPRFRLLSFVHFLRGIGALDVEGVVAEKSSPTRFPQQLPVDDRRVAALRMLGIEDEADLDTVKRAYRRLARALHPDLQPEVDVVRKRILERRFAEITAAYETLT
ncbi:MAG: J domain-containing protein, partial [Deltaproteobacteria bacterium]|nr:J domain-containing protein [Deltaproteobacteria bacterium]